MEIYDKVAVMLKSTSNKASSSISVGNPGRRSLLKTYNPNEAKGLLVLKNVLQPVYNKFKQFRLNIQADQFRPLVAAFLYNFDRAVEAMEAPPPVIEQPDSPTLKADSSRFTHLTQTQRICRVRREYDCDHRSKTPQKTNQ